MAGEPGGGTRARIQQVALRLFTENGYEGTSLREIAEALGVTKAALYYHFKSKEEIVKSLVDDKTARIEELLKWAQEQPRTLESRQAFLRRYSGLLQEGGHHELMHMFERNQPLMVQHKAGLTMRALMVEMLDVLSEGDEPLADQIRSALAIFALHSTWFTVRNAEATEEQRRAAALEVALDLIA